jgi:hypothetical protein
MKVSFIALSLLSMGLFAQTPTWSDDIACIVYSHCTSCHRPGNIGPFPLTSFADAAPLANQMAAAAQAKRMPPWPPDAAYRSLAHERILTDAEINALVDWAQAGAPSGNLALAPPAPVFSTAYEMTNPDVELVIPTYTIPAIGADLYRCFVLPTTVGAGTQLVELEIVPGNRGVVHHVLAYQDNSGVPAQLDAADPQPGYTSFGGIGSPSAELLGGWVPGATMWTAPPGMAMNVDANTSIVLQIHYPVGSTGQLDSTRIRMKFSNGTPLRPMGLAPILEHGATLTNGPLVIPPNQVKTFHNQYTINTNATLTLVGPHAHLLAKSMKSFAVKPNGDTVPLIDIPEWDFHWQGFYSFRQPIVLPAGSVLHGYATYDNTTNNPNNPNNPPQWVTLGEATDEEMMLFYFGYTYALPGDENLVIDTAQHANHHMNCGFLVSTEEVSTPLRTLPYPNPVDQVLHVAPVDAHRTWRWINLQGAVLSEGVLLPNQSMDWSVEGYASGLYLLELNQGATVERHRVVVGH